MGQIYPTLHIFCPFFNPTYFAPFLAIKRILPLHDTAEGLNSHIDYFKIIANYCGGCILRFRTLNQIVLLFQRVGISTLVMIHVITQFWENGELSPFAVEGQHCQNGPQSDTPWSTARHILKYYLRTLKYKPRWSLQSISVGVEKLGLKGNL